MKIHEVTFQGETFRFKEPLEFERERHTMSRGTLWVYENEHLGIDICAESMEMLKDELAEEVSVLWWEYAQESDERLTDSAIELKRRLLAAIDGPAGDRGNL